MLATGEDVRGATERLVADGEVNTKGATFAQTLSATLSRSTDDFERVAPGVYKAKEADACSATTA